MAPISIKAEDKPIWSYEDVVAAAEDLNISTDYIEQYNSYDLYTKKVKELNAQEGVTTEKELQGYRERTTIKTIYLDDNKKIPLTITDVTTTPTSASQLRYTEGDHTYTSTYKPFPRVTLKQYVAYTERIYTLNQIQSRVNDCYGVYSGIGTVSSDSNYSRDLQYTSWARTSFTYSASSLTSYFIANTRGNCYGVWTTEWS